MPAAVEPPRSGGAAPAGSAPPSPLPSTAAIAGLASDELVRLYRAVWKASRKVFCFKYGLDRNPFRHWLKQHAQYTDYGNEAVRKMLMEEVQAGEHVGQRTAHSALRTSPSLQGTPEEETRPRTNNYPIADLKARLKDLMHRAPVATCEDFTIFFIDGDSCVNELLSLRWLLPSSGPPPYVAVVIAGAVTQPPVWWPLHDEWCMWFKVPYLLLDAADHVITLAAGGLSLAWEYVHHAAATPRIVLVSHDKFTSRVAAGLRRGFGVKGAGVDPKSVSLVLWYLFHLTVRAPTPAAQAMKAALDSHYSSAWKFGDSTEALAERLTAAFDDEKLAAQHVTPSTFLFLDELALSARQRPASPTVLPDFASLSLAPRSADEPLGEGQTPAPKPKPLAVPSYALSASAREFVPNAARTQSGVR